MYKVRGVSIYNLCTIKVAVTRAVEGHCAEKQAAIVVVPGDAWHGMAWDFVYWAAEKE